jgi:single-stranded DNA-binding protein
MCPLGRRYSREYDDEQNNAEVSHRSCPEQLMMYGRGTEGSTTGLRIKIGENTHSRRSAFAPKKWNQVRKIADLI